MFVILYFRIVFKNNKINKLMKKSSEYYLCILFILLLSFCGKFVYADINVGDDIISTTSVNTTSGDNVEINSNNISSSSIENASDTNIVINNDEVSTTSLPDITGIDVGVNKNTTINENDNNLFSVEKNNIFVDDIATTSENYSLVEDFADINFFSDYEVKIINEILPGSSILFIPEVDKDNITIKLENLPVKNLYFYVDSLEHVLPYSMNDGLSMTFNLDGNKPHLIFIKSYPSTKTIRNDATGGDCSTFGIWNEKTLTCTMTQNVYEVIDIVDNDITLDGNGKMVKNLRSFGTGSGVHISFRNNITVKNLIVEGFDDGFGIFNTTNSTFLNNETRGFGIGFYLGFNDLYNIINGNIITNRSDYIPGKNITSSGIYLGGAANWTTIINNTITVSNIGLVLISNANKNKIYNNNFLSSPTISSSDNSGNSVFQPMPIGGNYYFNYDNPNNGCNDANNDSICDRAIIFGNTIDVFPWRYKNGWKGDRFPNVECCSNVIFIPGLEGSRLYTKGLLSENQLWEPNRNADVEKLYLDDSGNSINQNIYTRDIIKRSNVGLGIWDENVYQSFADSLDSLVAGKKINNWEAIPYDWRYDLNKIISDGVLLEDGSKLNFIDEVIKMASSSQTGKVAIVTHSNGGLLAKVLINELKKLGKDNLIDNLIMVAAPQLGTPSSISAMLHGDGQEIAVIQGLYYFLNKPTARTLGENMMGAYNLLPQAEYFTKVASPVVKFDESVDSVNNLRTKYGDVIDNYSELSDFLLGVDGRSEPANSDIITPNVLKSNLLSLAEVNHNALDNWIPPSSIKVTQLAGWGIETVSGIEYFANDICEIGFIFCFKPKTIMDRDPIATEDGDSTVVVPSATAIYTAEKYYLDLKNLNYKYNTKTEHKDIFEATSTIKFVENIFLNSKDDLPQYITSDKPVSTDKKLILSLHSPMLLDVYTAKNEHTGVVANPLPDSDLETVEENIPGSRYLSIGDNKTIILNGGEDYTVKLKGTDDGVFTLETKVISSDGSIIQRKRYTNISTTKNTTGEMNISSDTFDSTNSTSTNLLIDSNGDGITDFNISPSDNQDTIPPVLTILGGNQITIKVGDNYTDLGAQAVDDVNGEISSLISTSTNLDITKPGTYYFNYTIVDSSGNTATSSRIINVVNRRARHNVNLPTNITSVVISPIENATQTISLPNIIIDKATSSVFVTTVDLNKIETEKNKLQNKIVKNKGLTSRSVVVRGEPLVFHNNATTTQKDNLSMTASVGSREVPNFFSIFSSIIKSILSVFFFHK